MPPTLKEEITSLIDKARDEIVSIVKNEHPEPPATNEGNDLLSHIVFELTRFAAESRHTLVTFWHKVLEDKKAAAAAADDDDTKPAA